jgi:hypothetical protein
VPRQHRSIQGSGDNTHQICGRTLLCRFNCAASGRQNCALRARGASAAGGRSTWRSKTSRHCGGAPERSRSTNFSPPARKCAKPLESFSRTNVKEPAALLDANLAECNDPRRRRGPHSDCARDGRYCAPWPPEFVGGHGATTTLPVGRARMADQEGLLRSIVDATCCRQAASGGAGADVETRRARMPLFPPPSIADHAQPRFAGGRSMLSISTRPLPHRSRVGTRC